jgi:hypothetical protein
MMLILSMKMRFNPRWLAGGHWFGWVALITCLLTLTRVQAQVVIESSVPPDNATGVSTTAPVVFTFSQAMDPTVTAAMFFNDTTFSPLPTTPAWSAGNTVLSCTPNPPFPSGTNIFWEVSGQTPSGTVLGGIPIGSFTTIGTGGVGGGGSGTNRYTTFSVGQSAYYQQTSNGPPSLYTKIPYLFEANITLASNRSALSATVELPSTSVSNLNQDPLGPENFYFSASDTNLANLDAIFGSGDYIFTVVAATSNQVVPVNLPATLVLPAAPEITSFTAAQSVDSAQPFTLTWGAFPGGTAADFIYVIVGTNFSTSTPGNTNALPGTATSVKIPANTLQAGSNYNCVISFYRVLTAPEKSGQITAAFRNSVTLFNLTTTGTNTGGATAPITLTNPSWSGHTFSFDVTSAVGQSLLIQFNSSGALSANQWQTLLATNSATGVVQVSDSVNTTSQHILYRARTGP